MWAFSSYKVKLVSVLHDGIRHGTGSLSASLKEDSKSHVFDIFLSVQMPCNVEINQLNPSNTSNENYA